MTHVVAFTANLRLDLGTLATGRYDPRWGKEVWGVLLQLDDSRLKGHSVLWAQFDEDPVQQFRLDLKKNRELLRENLAQIKVSDEQPEKRSMFVAALWNRLFRQVTGEQIQQLAPSQEIAHVLTSNEPREVVWIATKATMSKGTHICWSSSVETKLGSMITLSLTAENALDLGKIFLEVLGDK